MVDFPENCFSLPNNTKVFVKHNFYLPPSLPSPPLSLSQLVLTPLITCSPRTASCVLKRHELIPSPLHINLNRVFYLWSQEICVWYPKSINKSNKITMIPWKNHKYHYQQHHISYQIFIIVTITVITMIIISHHHFLPHYHHRCHLNYYH